MGGRAAQTWPARNKRPKTQEYKHPFFSSPPSPYLWYPAMRALTPHSPSLLSFSSFFSFLSLCLVVLCCTLTRTPHSPGVCQQRLGLAHIATGSDHNNNAEEEAGEGEGGEGGEEENLFLFVAGRKLGCQLKTTN